MCDWFEKLDRIAKDREEYANNAVTWMKDSDLLSPNEIYEIFVSEESDKSGEKLIVVEIFLSEVISIADMFTDDHRLISIESQQSVKYLPYTSKFFSEYGPCGKKGIINSYIIVAKMYLQTISEIMVNFTSETSLLFGMVLCVDAKNTCIWSIDRFESKMEVLWLKIHASGKYADDQQTLENVFMFGYTPNTDVASEEDY